MSATNSLPTLSLEAAKVAAEAAQEKAKQMGIGTLLHQSSKLVFNHPVYLLQHLPLNDTNKTWNVEFGKLMSL